MATERSKIFIVDDNMTNLDMGRNMLKANYEVYPAISAAKLFELLENVMADLILLAVDMPDMNGYEAIKRLKNDGRYSDIPVIFLSAKNDPDSELAGFNLGAVDYVTKPFSGPLLLKRIQKELLIVQQTNELLNNKAYLEGYNDQLTVEVIKKTEEIVALQNAVLTTVADLVEFRDKHTGGHIERTSLYLKALFDELVREDIYWEHISGWDKNTFLSSAQLHDVGKIGIPDHILNKPEKLSPEEFDIIKTHVLVGVDAVEKIMGHIQGNNAFLNHARAIVGTHHEKWDGSGYPMGLKGSNIPLEGRLMAIADVYDALVTERPYRIQLTAEEASNIIKEGAGVHFDPVLVDVFSKVEGEFANIAATFGRAHDQ
jgi:putative two-component system response regulator